MGSKRVVMCDMNDPVTPVVKPATPAPKPFSMEAVVVCDKYADFLAQTLPHNKFLFNKIVVVTSYEDKETQKVCEYHHVMCVRTDVIMARKGEFHKGKAINVGLSNLSLANWVVHMDADMYLPPQTRMLLQDADLDPSMIYGIDRFNVRGFPKWSRFISAPPLQHENETYIHMKSGFPLGTRVMQKRAQGYVPIGFFQFWNPQISGVSKYPEGHTDAGREDMLFAMQWPRNKRGFIPEVIGYHLESEDASFSSNWKGRVTKPFAPEEE